MTPLLYRGGLTGSVYVATRHHVNAKGLMVADEKFDVTDQYEALRQGTVFYRLCRIGSDWEERADGPDDWSGVDLDDRDCELAYRIERVTVEVIDQRTFPANYQHHDQRFAAEVTNFEQMPETVDKPASEICRGDWVWDGSRFWEVDDVHDDDDDPHLCEGEVCVYMNQVGRPVPYDHVYPVAVDPDWARDWSARR